MPRRNGVLATNEIYHIYNRSIAKEVVFDSSIHLRKSIEIIDYYRFSQEIRLSEFKNLPKEQKESYLLAMKNKDPIVEIYSFAFMPNHFHFLLKQLQERGITSFTSNFQNSFAKYFNIKNERDGGLFQSPFKGRWIENDEEFIHVSRYIHLNPVASYLINFKKLYTFPWTSFPYYVNDTASSFINTNFLLGMFQSRQSYIDFVSDQVDYQRRLSFIKNLIIE